MQDWQKNITDSVPEGPPTDGKGGENGSTIKSKSLWTYAVGMLVIAVVSMFGLIIKTLTVDKAESKEDKQRVETEIRQRALISERAYERVERRADSLSRELDKCREQRIDDFFNNIKFKEGPNKITITKKK